MANEVAAIPAASEAAAAGEAGAGGFALEKILDPGLVSALGPQSGLQVEPVLFQAIETEGRWKPGGLINTAQNTVPSTSRVFELAGHAEQQPQPPDPPEFKLNEPYGKVLSHTTHLFTLDVQGYSSTALAVQMLGVAKELPDAVKQVLNVDANQDLRIRCTLSVDANYWSDGLEIYAGWAGMTSASGFYSAFNTTASVSLQAIPFGNYFPASVLVTWSGWVNPPGPDYWEFRGGIVLNADGSNSASLNPGVGVPGVQQSMLPGNDGPPAFMTYWGRDPNQPARSLNYSPNNGFLLQPPDLLFNFASETADTATNAWMELLGILEGWGPVLLKALGSMPPGLP
jgi:hypothetical protein